jgi:hypothetical protein
MQGMNSVARMLLELSAAALGSDARPAPAHDAAHGQDGIAPHVLAAFNLFRAMLHIGEAVVVEEDDVGSNSSKHITTPPRSKDTIPNPVKMVQRAVCRICVAVVFGR